jgi:gamma-glutamylcyclotransferase
MSIAYLPKYELGFHKLSDDGSGKCNAFANGAFKDGVYGVVYEIPPD